MQGQKISLRGKSRHTDGLGVIPGNPPDAPLRSYAVASITINNLDWVQPLSKRRKTRRRRLCSGRVKAPLNTWDWMPGENRGRTHTAARDAASRPWAQASGPYRVFLGDVLDASRLRLEQHIARKRQVVDLCHPLGIAAQGQRGPIGGADGDLTVDERVTPASL